MIFISQEKNHFIWWTFSYRRWIHRTSQFCLVHILDNR